MRMESTHNLLSTSPETTGYGARIQKQLGFEEDACTDCRDSESNSDSEPESSDGPGNNFANCKDRGGVPNTFSFKVKLPRSAAYARYFTFLKIRFSK